MKILVYILERNYLTDRYKTLKDVQILATLSQASFTTMSQDIKDNKKEL